MGLIDMHDPHQTPPLGIPKREQLGVLDHLWLCHERGPGPHKGQIKPLRTAVLLGSCLVISAASVAFAQYIPPFISFVLVGFILGIGFSGVRRQVVFRRIWPLFDAIIDWKHVDKLRRMKGGSDEEAA